MRPVPAAGTVPWRVRADTLEVALVHRPRYDDWSWPKGKLDPGERWAETAARETGEETGLIVRLGLPLPAARYDFLDWRGTPATKEVRYWAAEVIGGAGRLDHEIDQIDWLDPAAANSRLDYARDRAQLRAVVAAHRDGRLATWPLIVVRHGRALARSNWHRPDWLRPLDSRGREQAKQLVPLLSAYAPERLVTSSSTRCRDTLAPYADARQLRLRDRDDLSEETFEADPRGLKKLVDKAFAKARPVALCSHRPVLPAIFAEILAHEDPHRPQQELRRAMEHGMAKGEAIVVHIAGTGPDARIVTAERHFPLVVTNQ
ncbi:MAG: NUDIX hydrolase [Tetrasphaera sp.]